MRGGGRARAIVSLVLLAFVLQIAVTRSHFHFGHALDGVSATVATQDAAADLAAGVSKPSEPAHDDAQCPFWHAAGVCGAAAVPHSIAVFVPQAARLGIAIDERLIFPERFAAAWRSRAPPSV